MTADLHIEGARLLIVPFAETDLTEDYVAWLNDPIVTRYSNQRFVTHTRTSCRAYFDSFAGTSNLFLSLRSKEESRAIGTMTVYRNLHHGTADVGILIGAREHWSGGYGREAWNLVLDWLLNELRVRKVTAGALACNHAMIRLMESSGMALEGVRRAQEIVDNEAQDILLYGRFAK